MSHYQEGYDKGYADASAGDPSDLQWPMGLLDFINTEAVTEWEEGYKKGYEDGKEE